MRKIFLWVFFMGKKISELLFNNLQNIPSTLETMTKLNKTTALSNFHNIFLNFQIFKIFLFNFKLNKFTHHNAIIVQQLLSKTGSFDINGKSRSQHCCIYQGSLALGNFYCSLGTCLPKVAWPSRLHSRYTMYVRSQSSKYENGF